MGAKMIDIGFTGTQRGMSAHQMDTFEEVLDELSAKHGISSFHHGDCIGADVEAARIADKVFGLHIVGHPPLNDSKRGYYPSDEWAVAKPYLVRNKHIVEATQVLLAAPSGREILRSGTWSTVRYAKKLGKRIIFIM